MTTTEDILLQANNVRHKKSDGTLFLMSERIGWLMGSKDTFSVSYKYSDIKMQKISPEGKAKIQLQVVLHDGGASTFHFNAPDGEEAQKRDRDAVKELLQTLLPKFKRKVNKELEEKERLLRENPALLQLYQDLVITRIATADEFWEQHAAEFINKTSCKQDVGVSGAFLADIKPQTDGCNGLKYNLNVDTINSIYKTYPAVRRKFFEYVPGRMSESEFWTRFFQSHYFHRDRINLSSKDLFTDCAKQDEKVIQGELEKDLEDPMLDLRRMTDTTVGDGYGTSTDTPSSSQTNTANISMIRRFNQHSMNVLKASLAAEATAQPAGQPQQNGHASGGEPSAPAGPDLAAKKARLEERTCYADLEAPVPAAGQALSLTKVERYLSGPTPDAPRPAAEPPSADAAGRLCQGVRRWQPFAARVLDPQAAVSVLGDLSPGGALMKTSHKERNAAADLPDQVKTELAAIYRSAGELLRHFWTCFPVSTPALEEKVAKVQDTLHKFHQLKIRQFEDGLCRQAGLGPDVTAHLNQMLAAAYAKYEQWRSVRRLQR
ncbi:general transcription factor IIH subunit 1-like [Pollicipes pollicipes]|uniref:general transcription factor IIH subunit 1-like n=1 Tax=Pollicipes pollicipes TaxID=41117 RepID=UPI001884BEDB|nr:general transcription factor IIH subunit 1-like [Pollicipes pollicipes]XP_037070766.1 general transcription factor IIH subunit 1-like [Pollicipes pollicipes]XP_037070767.1 general transcription factor IIH subunit 1-like [Pollicipes pollicipes]